MPEYQNEPSVTTAFHISKHATTRFERRIALLIAVFLLTAVCVVIPFAKVMLPEIQAFLPIFIGIVFIVDLITAFLLFSEFQVNRMLPHAMLAGAYMFSAIITVPHMLTFPGAFSPTGMLQAGTQTATWLWVFWHGAYPLLLLLYVWAERTHGTNALKLRQVRIASLLFPLLVLAVVALLSWIAIYKSDVLPQIIQTNNYLILTTSGVGPALWLINAMVLAVLLVRFRGRTVLALWVTVAVFAFMLDVTLSLFSSVRFSVGWYTARMISLFSASVLMGKMLIELRNLYYRARQDKEHIQSITESTREGMLMCDSNGTILYVNGRCRSLIGDVFQAGKTIEAVLQKLSGQLKPAELLERSIRTLLNRSEGDFTEYVAFYDGMETRHLEFYGTRVGLGKGGPHAPDLLLVLRDRTEEERIDEMKTELISVVSHELRTPLTSISGFLEILLNREIDAARQKRYLDTMYKEATRLTDLINDFLDLQRMESGKQEFDFVTLELCGLVQEIAEQWDGKHQHHIHVKLPAEPVYIRADADRIKQVLHNLISNAVKYSPEADRIDLNVSVHNGQVHLYIRDFGLGIPEEARPNLFTKFFRIDNSDRRKIGGTGLGLSIVKDIVAGHQGRIDFESEMGKGTTFVVTLPLSAAENS